MKNIFILLSLFVLALSSCTKTRQVNLIDSNYLTWNKVNKVPLDYEVPGHGANLRVIYANELAMQVKNQDTNADILFPNKSLLVKEVYEGLKPSSGAQPKALLAMLKEPNNPAAVEGWVWIVKPANEEEKIISTKFCATCHAVANETFSFGQKNLSARFQDYVFFVPGVLEAQKEAIEESEY